MTTGPDCALRVPPDHSSAIRPPAGFLADMLTGTGVGTIIEQRASSPLLIVERPSMGKAPGWPQRTRRAPCGMSQDVARWLSTFM